VHQDLVDELRLEALQRHVGTEHDDVAAARRLLRGLHRALDLQVEEPAGDPLDDRRLSRRIVSEDEERAAVAAAVETRLLAILDVLRPPTDEQCSRRPYDLVDRLVRS